jgi:hypothetical protein
MKDKKLEIDGKLLQKKFEIGKYTFVKGPKLNTIYGKLHEQLGKIPNGIINIVPVTKW